MLSNLFLFVRVVLFAAVVPLLSRLPMSRLEKLVEPSETPYMPDEDRVMQIIRYTDWFCRVARRFIASRCMTRGLTLYYFLKRAGLTPSLVFGAGNDLENFTGHCWLVLDGEPYLEKVDPRPFFTPMYSFSASESKDHPSKATKEACD